MYNGVPLDSLNNVAILSSTFISNALYGLIQHVPAVSAHSAGEISRLEKS